MALTGVSSIILNQCLQMQFVQKNIGYIGAEETEFL